MTISSEVEAKQVRIVKGTGSQIASARQAGEILDTDLVVQTDAPEPITIEQVNTAIEAKIIDSTSSTSTTSALSANKGKVLQDEIDNVKARGRFLSVWNCSTGLPDTNPEESPYPYKAGDYYIVGTVGSGTKYKPNGASFTIGVASTTVETNEVNKDDTYLYDGTSWILQSNTQKSVTFSNLAGSPYDNTNLANALDSKLEGVQVNGTDLTITNKKVNIPVASTSALGVIKVSSGLTMGSDGGLRTSAATESLLVAKTNQYQPVVSSNLNIAIREGLGNNSLTWTDAYKTSARNTIGASQVSFVDWID